MDPLVYIVILNWNQPGFVQDCLSSLDKVDYPNYRIVVVDNGSTDDSVEVIRAAFPETIIIEIGDNLGYSEGNNRGILFALNEGAEYILLLNNDTTVESNMLSLLIEAAESDTDIGIVGPTQYYYDQPDAVWGAANYVQWHNGTILRLGLTENNHHKELALNEIGLIEADYIDTCAALIHRKVFERTGLLDDRYFINFDDADLCIRSCQAGFRVVHLPRASMWHKVSASMGQASPATTYYMTRNQLLLFWSHGKGLVRVFATLRIVFRTLRTIAAWTIKPEYNDKIFYRKRDANLFALRDFFLGRFGKMGPDVARVCYRD